MSKHYEQYLVHYDEKIGEYWQNGNQEEVSVAVLYVNKAKTQHWQARRVFEAEAKNNGRTIKVTKVTYC